MYVAASVVTCKMTTTTLMHALRVNEEGKDLACASTQPIVAKFLESDNWDTCTTMPPFDHTHYHG